MEYVHLSLQLATEDLEFVIKGAIHVGFRHIDTSVFNLNEKQIGNVLKTLIDEGKVSRSELFITTKLPPTANKPELVEPALLESLERLQMEYVDLYLIQLPVAFERDNSFDTIKVTKDGLVCLEATNHINVWKKMEDLIVKGLTKSIGLANFNQNQIQNLISNCTIVPAVLQIEYHIFLQQPILIEFCNSNNITVNAFAVLCTEDMLSSSHFLGKRLLPNIMEVAEVKELAEKYDKTEIQVLMRWIIEKNITILMRMNNSSRMHEIMGIFQFHLSKDDIQILNELDDNFRCVDLSAISGIENHPEYPFH
ncbi:alcohol dehydrogenase [NADP(+)] isoform X2 [Ceratitis capitata]|uniref:alcohol dehydrogenase [NADP(+)] isoform X2 n=1 Tax=Ceratitis capitata TaxID=7213 RepID=UPI000A1077D8|nr:alcohol dehydrogenase [NADP(+)] isoform X2 [Ceratitis capitata]